MKTKPHIFLCYAREDEEKVEQLYQKLSDVGFKPWMDTKDIMPGEQWTSRIQKAVRCSDFFLACLSANSVNKRGWIQREIKSALDIWQEKLEDDIYLIPVRLEDCETPESLREFQWVDLFIENGWTQLVKAIQEGMKRQTKASADGRIPRPAASRTDLDLSDIKILLGQIRWQRYREGSYSSNDPLLAVKEKLDRIRDRSYSDHVMTDKLSLDELRLLLDVTNRSIAHIDGYDYQMPPAEAASQRQDTIKSILGVAQKLKAMIAKVTGAQEGSRKDPGPPTRHRTRPS